jgi:hypothetical protein
MFQISWPRTRLRLCRHRLLRRRPLQRRFDRIRRMRWHGFIASAPTLFERALVPADETTDFFSKRSYCDIESPIFDRRTTRVRRAVRTPLHHVHEAEAVFSPARVVAILAQRVSTAQWLALPQGTGEVSRRCDESLLPTLSHHCVRVPVISFRIAVAVVSSWVSFLCVISLTNGCLLPHVGGDIMGRSPVTKVGRSHRPTRL